MERPAAIFRDESSGHLPDAGHETDPRVVRRHLNEVIDALGPCLDDVVLAHHAGVVLAHHAALVDHEPQPRLETFLVAHIDDTLGEHHPTILDALAQECCTERSDRSAGLAAASERSLRLA